MYIVISSHVEQFNESISSFSDVVYNPHVYNRYRSKHSVKQELQITKTKSISSFSQIRSQLPFISDVENEKIFGLLQYDICPNTS